MWLGLSRVPDDEGVILIRMYCTPPLQKALDNKIACEEWQRLAPAQAIDLLESITVKYTSRAADIGAFYNLKQGPYETIAAYFTRGHEVATSAKLRCPTCSQGLGNYLLLSKLAIGLHNEELRREAFRAFDTLKDVDHLRAFCIAHEAASAAATATGGPSVAGTQLAGSGLQTPAPASKSNDVTDNGADDVIAAIRGGARQK